METRRYTTFISIASGMLGLCRRAIFGSVFAARQFDANPLLRSNVSYWTEQVNVWWQQQLKQSDKKFSSTAAPSVRPSAILLVIMECAKGVVLKLTPHRGQCAVLITPRICCVSGSLLAGSYDRVGRTLDPCYGRGALLVF